MGTRRSRWRWHITCLHLLVVRKCCCAGRAGKRAGDSRVDTNDMTRDEMTRNAVQFIRSGRRVRIEQFVPRATLLDWLRLEERAVGTKEGCAEGDCGACAVVVARERNGRLVHESVNSCITLLGQIDGAELITIEDLARGWRVASDSGRDGAPARLAVRLLHARHRDEFVRALSFVRWPHRSRHHQRCAGRQPLPLHRLSADRGFGARCLQDRRRRSVRA